MHTYLTTHMHTNTDGPVLALYMKQDSELFAVFKVVTKFSV